MKKELKIAVNRTIVNHITREVDLPEVAKYYAKNDDGNFFPRGLILFAIIPNYENNPTNSYTLIQVERNKQDYNDFVPHDDPQSEFWLKGGSIRNIALDIIMRSNHYYDWKEIDELEFNSKRSILLNTYKSKSD